MKKVSFGLYAINEMAAALLVKVARYLFTLPLAALGPSQH